jgi:glycosyltransferase involved in cell wall biosynthesis
MRDPLISIVVCSYNRAHLLRETLDHILAQHYRPVEVVVFDDGSTDGTEELVRSYGTALRYFRQDNQGIAAARTAACRVCEGDLIAFQDDDDLIHPERLHWLLEALRLHPRAVMAVGDMAFIDVHGKPTGERWLPAREDNSRQPMLMADGHEAVLWPRVAAAPDTVLFRKTDGATIGWFDPDFRNASEDKDFFARLGRLGPLVHVPHVVSYHRGGHRSLTTDRVSVAYHQLRLFAKHLRYLGPEQRRFRKRLRQRILQAVKVLTLHEGEGYPLPPHIVEARESLGVALLHWPEYQAHLWSKYVRFPLRKLISRTHPQ